MLLKNPVSSPLICKVEFSFLDDILSMEPVELHQVKITMQPEKAFKPMYGTPASFSFFEPSEVSASGVMLKQKLSLYYPGLDKDARSEIIAMERKPVVVKIHFTNGLILVMGSLEVPAMIISIFNSSDATGYTVTFSSDTDERSRILIVD